MKLIFHRVDFPAATIPLAPFGSHRANSHLDPLFGHMNKVLNASFPTSFMVCYLATVQEISSLKLHHIYSCTTMDSTMCNIITCSISNSSSKCGLECTAKVLAVCTAIWHLYSAHAHATWCGSTAHAKSAPYISPALVCTTQGQKQGAYNHHSLLGYTERFKLL